ncbi:selenocysteine-specific translation elongation factor [Beijerinckia sp. L45]|uniref:selenocysteine-specific translation elongation factor n=1 Tax=Beijerinckia sp. L45 TaxID=1641855 RepID=UPI00131E4867|nr:selenocysteine-specific translation elongation factor [Beijerinckia sp. L45]
MIVGTAGHVDHGKTQLIQALTGVDTDRLKEEKARGITIDLGFAYIPDGQGGMIGFVDVPGHERLVHTMLAGAAGIDFALLVVAADDGVMPQTREHLQILDLLGLTQGLIVLSKADLADAPRRAALIADIRAACAGTGLQASDILPVSSLTGEGIDELRARLLDEAASQTERTTAAPFRFTVDRAFTLAGAGTVVTGTVVSGRVAVDDVVTILPSGIKARVRSLHVSNQAASTGHAGERCALNLAGADVTRQALARGCWLVDPARTGQTPRFDMAFTLLATESRALAQWTPVHVHCGASSMLGRVVLLADEPLRPGDLGLVQIVLPEPLPVRHGDRVVLRDTSASRTIGGGLVLDPRAPARKRRSPQRMARLEALAGGDPATALIHLIAIDPGFEDLSAFAEDWSLPSDDAERLTERLSLMSLAAGPTHFVTAADRWRQLTRAIEGVLAAFHEQKPELPGMAIDHVRLALRSGLPRPLFAAIATKLARDGVLALKSHWLRLPAHSARLGADDALLWARIKPLIERDRFKPPRVRDLGLALEVAEQKIRRTCKSLVRVGELTEVAHDHFFPRAVVAEMARIAARLSTPEKPEFSASDFRDQLDNGRKVAIQILEFFDREGLTLRRGDVRRTVKDPALVFGTPEGVIVPADAPARP